MKIILLVLLVASFIFAQSPSGARLILSTAGINNLLQKEIPYIKQAVLDAVIPELNVEEHVGILGKVDVTVQGMKINSVDFGPLAISTQAPNIVSIGTTSASLTFTAQYHFREHSFPHIKGSGQIDGQTSNDVLQVAVAIDVVNGKPKFRVAGINIQIANFKLHFAHSPLAWLINILEGLFKGAMRDIVQKSVTGALTDVINNKANQAMDRTNFANEVKLFGGKIDFVADMSLPDGAISAAGDHFALSSLGTAFAVGKHDFPPFQPVALPTAMTTGDLANIFVTDYTVNSALYVLHTTGQLNLPILPADVPDWSMIKLNTTSLKLYLPELYAKYPDKDVRLDVSATAAPSIQTTPTATNMACSLSILWSVFVNPTTVEKAFITSVDLQGQFTNASIASVAGGTDINVYGALKVTSDVKLTQSFMGEVNVTTFGKIVQLLVINGQVARFNQELKAGIPLGLATALPGVTVTDSKLVVNNGYVAVDGNLNYTPTKKVEQSNEARLLELLFMMAKKIENLQDKVASLEDKVTCQK